MKSGYPGQVGLFGGRVQRAGVMIVLASFVGCAAVQDSVSMPPSVSAVVPSEGASLASYGIANGPAGFSLPADLGVLGVIDQPNVVTVSLPATEGRRVVDYLRVHLAGMGFEIVGQADDALVFERSDWRGAVTFTDEAAAVTLRRK